MGFTAYAKALEQQAVTMAYASHNDGIIASIVPYLAFYHAREGDYAAAEKYLEDIEISRGRMETAGGRELTDLSVNLLCSQVMTAKEKLQAAERCLMQNLNILDRQQRAAPDYFAETLLQLAGIQAARSQVDPARQSFRRAIEVIEENDAYLATTVLRMPFESQRRDIYDIAVRFEYDQGSRDSAWIYLQRYRSKLFLEFLKQMNSSVAGVLDRAIDRDKVQELIPADVQVLEYVMLEDRLLIWLVSRDRFDSISKTVSRRDVEGKISAFLTQINRKADIESQSSELYKLLIEPIEDRLDPAKKLAIVPDLALHRLNFPALYSDKKKTFLIQQYIILESPNLTTLLSGGLTPPTRSNAFSFGARTDSVGATGELRELGQIYKGIRTFNGQSALKPAFLSSLREARVFHYAGHSQDAADPLRSSVLLDGEREGPNSVTALEISKHKMPANSVVVLASCDSSVGNSRDGIGMRGLTSAFLISGAGSVVGSLWLVESESTSRLVLDFHRDFAKNGTPVAVALRNAQLAFIADGLHPYYWSGFVVTGNASALR
jgi:CHAT domain-containing protein